MQFLNTSYLPLKILIVIGVILNVFLWIFTFRFWQSATDLIPLHYTIYFGIDLIDFRGKLFTYPLFGFFILFVNSILLVVFKKEKLIQYFLASGALLSMLLLAITEVALIVNHF